MRHIHLLGFHVAAPNIDALAARMMSEAPLKVTSTSILHGQGGASYEALIRECRSAGRSAWDGLLVSQRVAKADAYGIVCWSAGYGAARELLRVEGAPPDVLLWAFLDSIYGTRGADGRPVPTEMALWAKLARAAVAGGHVMLVGASDIDYMERTPTPPSAQYLSTGTMARAIAASVSGTLEPFNERRPRRPNEATHTLEAGALRVELHDVGPGVGAEEHVAAVLPSGWGDDMMAWGACMLPLLMPEPTLSDTEPPPASASPVLAREGDRGGDVVRLQREIGCRADGVWGPATSRALAALQRGAGLHVRATWGDVERAALAAMPRGIDVSHHQPPIDWDRVRAAGYEFVVVRSGDGTLADRRAREHWEAAGRAGMLRMAYHFLRAGQPIAPQVSVATATLPEAIGWWVDVEDGRSEALIHAGAPAQHHVREEVDLAHRMLLATARNVGDYSAWGWWEACALGAPSGAVWNAGPNNDHVFGGAPSWLCWQPDARAVPGVTGACDVDVWSSRAALAEWAV